MAILPPPRHFGPEPKALGSPALLRLGLVFLLLTGVAAAQVKSGGSSTQFDALAGRAAEAGAQNRLGEAVRLYRRALALRPDWTKGWWSLGTLEYDQSQYAQAARAFEKVVKLDARNGTARVMLGLCQFELGQDGAALANLRTGQQMGVANEPQLRHVMLYHEGILLLRKGMFRTAQQELKKISHDGVENDKLTLALGMSMLMIRPDNAPPRGTPGRQVVVGVGKAEALGSRDRFREAKQLYLDVVEEYPTYPNVHYAYGRFLLEIHDTQDAIAEFKKELKNNPDQVNAMLEIAAVHYGVNSAAGVKYAERAVELSPQRPFAHYLLGLLYLDTGEAAKAIPHLEMARRAFPTDASIYYALGSAYAKVGRKQEARQARRTFLRLKAEENKQGGPTVFGQQASEPSLHGPGSGTAAAIPH